jgi:signal transduction histidine kinase
MIRRFLIKRTLKARWWCSRGPRSASCSLLDRVRAHVAGGRGAYVPKGFEEALPVGDHIFLPRAAPIYGDAGEVTGVAIVLQDVTKLFHFDELKSNLVATVAHEFRTPLTSLRMAIHRAPRAPWARCRHRP